MILGNLVMLQAPVDAFDNKGEAWCLDPGSSALVLGYNEYDITLLVCGEVLYTSVSNERNIEKLRTTNVNLEVHKII
jgi:hypothetical protein